jgi:hypothetical protein
MPRTQSSSPPPRLRRSCSLLALALCLLATRGALGAGDAGDAPAVQASAVQNWADVAYEQRVAFVRTLLETSSAARGIEAGGSSDALTRLDGARQRLAQAQQARAMDDSAAANRLLVEAIRIMFEAVRLAEPAELAESVAGAGSAATQEPAVAPDPSRDGGHGDTITDTDSQG